LNYYQKHIGDFNSATRHLTRIERSIYSDMIELYYDKEVPLPSNPAVICRKVLARDELEIDAVGSILAEFFELKDDGYFNRRCQDVIDKFQSGIKNKSKAGRASAKKRIAASNERLAANPRKL